MARYYFSFNFRDQIAHQAERHDHPNLTEALAAAHRRAQSLVRQRLRHNAALLRGNLDIEDEGHRLVARILFADVARQMA